MNEQIKQVILTSLFNELEVLKSKLMKLFSNDKIRSDLLLRLDVEMLLIELNSIVIHTELLHDKK